MSVSLTNPTAQLSSATVAIVDDVQTTTSTGTQSNFALDYNYLVLRCNNASALTFTGFAVSGGNVAGARVLIENVGTSTVKFTHDATSTAANRFYTVSTNGQILGAGGRALAVYDATQSRWILRCMDPGAWVSHAHASGDYTSSGTLAFTVASGDLTSYRYQQHGATLRVAVDINTASLTAGTGTMIVKLPTGFTPRQNTLVGTVGYGTDNTTASDLRVVAYDGLADLYLFRVTGAWANSTNLTSIAFAFQIEVD